jgi:hypothetical protein
MVPIDRQSQSFKPGERRNEVQIYLTPIQPFARVAVGDADLTFLTAL